MSTAEVVVEGVLMRWVVRTRLFYFELRSRAFEVWAVVF